MEENTITAVEIDECVTNTVNSVFGAIAQCKNTVMLEKILVMVVSLCVGLLRGLKGNEFVKGVLEAAIKDKDNVIEVKEANPVQ